MAKRLQATCKNTYAGPRDESRIKIGAKSCGDLLWLFSFRALCSTVAMVADMPAPDNYVPPSAAPVVTPFQGFYLGGFLGYGGPW